MINRFGGKPNISKALSKKTYVKIVFNGERGIYYIFCHIESFSFGHCIDWQFANPRCAS